MTSIANALLDLSLTELSVHYIRTSQLPVGNPYLNLETELLFQTQKFYEEKFQFFSGHP